MFATPFSAPLHKTLASHVFSRFLPQSDRVMPVLATAAPVVDTAESQEEQIDLAQRVREVGEW